MKFFEGTNISFDNILIVNIEATFFPQYQASPPCAAVIRSSVLLFWSMALATVYLPLLEGFKAVSGGCHGLIKLASEFSGQMIRLDGML